MHQETQRIFVPGDNWLYIKLYTGYKTADIILSQILPRIISQLDNKELIKHWFFIHYSDPEFHLRLRFYLNDKKAITETISILNKQIKDYINDDLIWKVQIDTYQRELERYGQKTIMHAETIFHKDSEAIIKIINIITNEGNDEQRWLFSLKLVDELLNDFEFKLDKKINLLDNLSQNFKEEFGFTSKAFRLQLNRKYRLNQKSVEEIMNKPEKIPWAFPLLKIINQRSLNIKPTVQILIQMSINNELEIPLENLIKSYIHMTINRLFRSKQRLYELVIYDILMQYYTSLKARIKYNSKVKMK